MALLHMKSMYMKVQKRVAKFVFILLELKIRLIKSRVGDFFKPLSRFLY